MAESSQYFLIEALAERIAEICLGRSDVLRAHVTVEKPAALRFTRTVAVEITRDRT
jgi:dihydroneopterin aldolase